MNAIKNIKLCSIDFSFHVLKGSMNFDSDQSSKDQWKLL